LKLNIFFRIFWSNPRCSEAQERFGKRTGLSADTIKRSLKSKV